MPPVYDVVVTESFLVIACAECATFWTAADAAKCVDPAHHRQQHEVHRHRTVVVLPDGTSLVAASFDDTDPYTRDRAPDYGLYLDDRWQPSWPHDRVDWPDFGVPRDPIAFARALRSVLDRARGGQRVEIGCLGGHGRTGTALACLAVLSGHPANNAVAWVRDHYCAKAVETDHQAAFVVTFSD
jgi:hypothetical protein